MPYSEQFSIVTQRLDALRRRIFAMPPRLSPHYSPEEYAAFMRAETYCYTPRYAKNRVVVHGGGHLTEIAKRSGGILACLHYGSFFLSGGAVVHQLGLPYTAVVTSRNLAYMPEAEAFFWKAVHRRCETLYGEPLFTTGSPPRTLLKWLAQRGNMLGVVLDVREHGHKVKEYPFSFLGQPIFMQAGPAKLACLARVPLVPMTIRYAPAERRHHLHFDTPIQPGDPVEMTQRALTVLGAYVAEEPDQQFNDIVRGFAQPHTA
jgi:lauroyl/myristoyl acyltransferase